MVTCILMVTNKSEDYFPVNQTSLFALPRSYLQLVYRSTPVLLKSRSTKSVSSALTWKRFPTVQITLLHFPFIRPAPLPFSTTWRHEGHTEHAILHISDLSNIPALAIRSRCIRAYSNWCWHALFASVISHACSCWWSVLQIFWGQCTSNWSGGVLLRVWSSAVASSLQMSAPQKALDQPSQAWWKTLPGP